MLCMDPLPPFADFCKLVWQRSGVRPLRAASAVMQWAALSKCARIRTPFCLQVVQEVYDEIALWQPTEDFFNRYATHTARPSPPSQLAQVGRWRWHGL